MMLAFGGINHSYVPDRDTGRRDGQAERQREWEQFSEHHSRVSTRPIRHSLVEGSWKNSPHVAHSKLVVPNGPIGRIGRLACGETRLGRWSCYVPVDTFSSRGTNSSGKAGCSSGRVNDEVRKMNQRGYVMPHTKKFREQLLKMAQVSGHRPHEITKGFGISVGSVLRWVK